MFSKEEREMAKGMNYDEFMEYALKHYNRGGDMCVECWDEESFDEDVALHGPMTKRRALAMFKSDYEYERDRAGWR